jgi:glutaredoxin-like protein
MTAQQDGVVVYVRPGCPYCMVLRLGLRRTGLEYTEVDIWKDPEAAAFVRSVADGNETVPTVVVAGRAMVNPSTAEVKAAVAEYAPQLLPAEGKTARRGRFGRPRRDETELS